MITPASHYQRFLKALRLYLPGCQILEKSDRRREYQRCLDEHDTYTIQVKLATGAIITLCGMTECGYFILKGNPYVWTWRECYCPNWIYKTKDGVEVWSAPVDNPWKLYEGRLKITTTRGTLSVEGCYGKGTISLLQFMCLHDLDLSKLEYFMSYDRDHIVSVYHKLLNGGWVGKENSLNAVREHPCLPHVDGADETVFFISLMLRNYLNETIPIADLNDLRTKRLISVEWMVGHICCDVLNPRIMCKMMRRIYKSGQLVNTNCYFDYLSHVTRVIRGQAGYGNMVRRELHKSHRGVYCPYRASEGENIGLVVDLVPDVDILYHVKKKVPDALCLNGVPVSTTGKWDSLAVESSTWYWTDGGRIHPGELSSVGYVARELIFLRHMPPVRAMYASTHLRQARRLLYPQKPIIAPSQKGTSFMNGFNAIVAVCGFDGWNIEDAIVCSRSFVERGGLQSIGCETVVQALERGESWADKNMQIPVHTILAPSSVYASKKSGDGTLLEKKGISGRVMYTHYAKSEIILKLESVHTVELGDKLSTRSGQKGIVGHVVNAEDMPFTEDGVIPDLIINPAHMPSRMTVSQMLESFLGKRAIYHGRCKRANSTLFPNFRDSDGKEVMICGKSGKKLRSSIFIGPVYYMALSHMVSKKCRVRGEGDKVDLTGQPTRGMRNNGGLRVGEMERDALRSRGCEEILKDRLSASSDRIDVMVCKACGWLEPNAVCCEHQDVHSVKMAKSTRLMLMETYALGIFPKLHIS